MHKTKQEMFPNQHAQMFLKFLDQDIELNVRDRSHETILTIFSQKQLAKTNDLFWL